MLVPLLLGSLGMAQSRVHVEASITIDLEAAPSVVLLLFGPIREAEWAHGWSPVMVYPSDGRQLPGSVFTTADERIDVVWIMTRFDERAREVEYAQVLPGVWAGEISIRLKETAKRHTQATVIYSRTALSAEADRVVDSFGRHFPEQRDHWQDAINRRLRAIAEQHEHN